MSMFEIGNVLNCYVFVNNEYAVFILVYFWWCRNYICDIRLLQRSFILSERNVGFHFILFFYWKFEFYSAISDFHWKHRQWLLTRWFVGVKMTTLKTSQIDGNPALSIILFSMITCFEDIFLTKSMNRQITFW